MEVFLILGGLSLGVVIGWLAGRRRTASDPARLAAIEERARAEADRRAAAERQVAEAGEARSELERRLAVAEEQGRQARALLAEERSFVETARGQMEQVFRATAADVLKGNSEQFTSQFLSLAGQRLETANADAASDLESRKAGIEALLAPLKATLDRLEARTGEIERARTEAYSRIDEQVRTLAGAAAGVQREAVVLSTALKGTQVRGRWGELALRNVVELAGMAAHVDYAEQETVDDGKRPDMVVRLPGARRVAVDSKATTDFYVEACRATTDEAREAALDRHAAAVRGRVRALASKEYAAHLAGSVDFVVLFLPGDPYLSAAFARDPDLLVDALKQKVLVATPTTLLALLRTLSLYHQHEALARDAAQIAQAAKTLYERGAKFAEHLGKVGKGLAFALGAYNDAVASFETRFLPAAGELEGLKAAEPDPRLRSVKRVDSAPRLPFASVA